jgi:two-component system cell cycle response regulator
MALKRCLALAVRQARLRTRLSAVYRNGGHPETNDPVTGLFSAEFLHRHLELLIEDAFRWDRNLTVVTCVIPGLEAATREHGRNAGAALRHAVATVVSRLVRGEDVCASLNDKTFCIAMPESSIEASMPIMNRVRGVIAHTEFAVQDVDRPILLRPELGNAEFKPGDTVESLVARAQDVAIRAAA